MGKLRIVSRSSAPFSDRSEAGRLLARELDPLRNQNVVVLGIPRGGIIPARELALALNGELDVILSHKLRTPGHPELAMGAVAEGGVSFIDPKIARMLGISVSMIEEEKALQMAELARRAAEIRKIRPKVSLEGRPVIITDDGIATGATTMTAVRSARFERPARLILALPVGPEDSVQSLADEADETLCLRLPAHFMAVGQFYLDFDQVSDQQMLAMLKEAQGRKDEK
jgi:putative phosphoribosyl transferase